MILLRNIFNNKFQWSTVSKRTVVLTSYCSARKTNAGETELDTPIKYTTSPAIKYKAKYSIKHDTETRLWYEPYVVIGSLSLFMIYFCVLREENDLDEQLAVPLFDRIEGLEELQLRNFLAYGAGSEEDINKAQQRLKEIEEEKKVSE
ncbi:hypothetical protein WA026_000442 [Henosepilachna vigintioctopunctata]|uniref:Uncharacterized protein n=1 Tax=Henosepilachna vigintioctopunctata TaxID=420089 RepID=A0AAW1UZA3_9CUCU